MLINNENLGVKFRNVVYSIKDIRYIYYSSSEDKLVWKLYNDTTTYDVTMSIEKAQKYIDFINTNKYKKVIQF